MIYVDIREMPSDILQVLDAMRLPYQKKMLELGDFEITGRNGNVVIERKTAADFIGSLISGHLNDQLIRMSKSYKHSIVIVEGSINQAASQSAVKRSSVYSSIVGSFMKSAGEDQDGVISLIMVDSIMDLALILQMVQKKLDDPAGLVRPSMVVIPSAHQDVMIRMLCCVPGIGENTAKEIKKVYPIMVDLVRASPEEISGNVRNVGNTLAKAVHDSLRGVSDKEDEKSKAQSKNL